LGRHRPSARCILAASAAIASCVAAIRRPRPFDAGYLEQRFIDYSLQGVRQDAYGERSASTADIAWKPNLSPERCGKWRAVEAYIDLEHQVLAARREHDMSLVRTNLWIFVAILRSLGPPRPVSLD